MTVTRHDIDWGAGGVRPSADRASWPFSRTDKGKPHSNLHNIGVVLDHEPTLIGIAWYDEFLERILTGVPAKEWTDHDDVAIAMRLQDDFGLVGARPQQVREVLEQRVRASPRHCVREWLEGLRWDGTPRIAEAFEDHWGVEIAPWQPDDYVRAVSANFFRGLVARVLRPGCQLDTMVVFEGAQGTGKTTALRTLGGPWYALSHESVTRKDFFEGLQGKWLIEIGELDAFSKAEVTRVKTVISTPTDRYRKSYGRSATDYPRQCVFAGTTNADNWGRDETGLRRFWPIRCGDINAHALAEARPQLFAEAASDLGRKLSWWDVPTSALRVQADRQVDAEHPWNEFLLPFLDQHTEVSIPDILVGPLKHHISDLSPATQQTVARLLKLASWKKYRPRREGSRRKLWVRNDFVEEGESDTAVL